LRSEEACWSKIENPDSSGKARKLGSWEARRLGEKEPIAYK